MQWPQNSQLHISIMSTTVIYLLRHVRHIIYQSKLL